MTEDPSQLLRHAPRRIKRKLEQTAHHEAGHVVAAWRLGVEFTHVTIVPSKDPRGVCLGSVYLPDVVHPDVIVLPISEVLRLKIEKQILVNLAGPEAQMRFNRDCVLGTLV